MKIRVTSQIRTGRLSAAFFLCLLTVFSVSLVSAQETTSPGAEALASGDTTKAISILTQDITTNPANDLSFELLGEIYYNREQFDLALTNLQKAVDLNGKNWSAVASLGKTLLALERPDDAEKLYTDALAKSKKESYLFENGLGLVAMSRKKYSDAQTFFLKAADKDSKNPEYQINLGDAYFYAGVNALAITAYEKALKLNASSTEAYFHWAEACLESRDFNCALEKLGIVIQRDSTYAPAWRRAGEIYFKAALGAKSREDKASRYKDVVGSYKKFFVLANAQPDSTTVRPFFELGMAYVNLGAYDSAAYYFDQVMAIPYEPKDIYFWYGKTFWGLKDYTRGAEMFLKHLEWVKLQDERYRSNVTVGELYQLLGDCYFYAKPPDFQNAATYYTTALETSTDNKRLIQNIAISYHTLKQYRKAMEFYDKRIALGIDSTSIGVLKNAGLCAVALTSGGTDDSTGAATTTTTIDSSAAPDTASARDYRKVAVDYLEQYATYKADDPKAIQQLANIYFYQLNDCKKGLQWYEQLQKLEPDNCTAAKTLGYIYMGGQCAKNFSLALQYLTKAYECQTKTGKPCGDLDIPLSIAQCYHLRASDIAVANPNDRSAASPDFKKAYEWYGEVLKCSPSHAAAKKGQADTKYEFN